MVQGGDFMYILGGRSIPGLKRYRHNGTTSRGARLDVAQRNMITHLTAALGLMEWSPESHVRTSAFFRAQVMRLMLLQSCGEMHDIPIELLFEVFRTFCLDSGCCSQSCSCCEKVRQGR